MAGVHCYNLVVCASLLSFVLLPEASLYSHSVQVDIFYELVLRGSFGVPNTHKPVAASKNYLRVCCAYQAAHLQLLHREFAHVNRHICCITPCYLLSKQRHGPVAFSPDAQAALHVPLKAAVLIQSCPAVGSKTAARAGTVQETLLLC